MTVSPKLDRRYWLGHADARQVCDLPLSSQLNLTVYDLGGSETFDEKICSRQV
jgi:hypothetical protein